MYRSFWLLAAVVAALVLAGGVLAGNGAQTQHATLASSWDGFAMTCEETQVINKNQRKETFHCEFTEPVPFPAFSCDESNCLWFSDFDGAEAVALHVVFTPSGEFNGWATY